MAAKLLIVLMALVVVAMAFEFEDPTDEQIQADIEFIKRDPVMQDYFLAEKRGQNMRKYKQCSASMNTAQTCWCTRRGNKVAFCSGAGTGAAL